VAGGRAQAPAPQDMSSQLRMTARAEADAWQQSADAEAEHDHVRAENASGTRMPRPERLSAWHRLITRLRGWRIGRLHLVSGGPHSG
jgi:hypothetical protein